MRRVLKVDPVLQCYTVTAILVLADELSYITRHLEQPFSSLHFPNLETSRLIGRLVGALMAWPSGDLGDSSQAVAALTCLLR